jgi:FKBP-type peptidyl-prolyl cis-trans isomerase 2
LHCIPFGAFEHMHDFLHSWCILAAVRYTIRVEGSDKVVAETGDSGAEFSVEHAERGSANALPAFAEVLKGMKKGEKVSLLIKPQCECA